MVPRPGAIGPTGSPEGGLISISQLRLAVIGARGQCTRALMPAIPSLEEVDLVALCDLKS